MVWALFDFFIFELFFQFYKKNTEVIQVDPGQW